MREGYDEEWYNVEYSTDFAKLNLKRKLDSGKKIFMHGHEYNVRCNKKCGGAVDA